MTSKARQSDETVLRLLDLRTAGLSPTILAERTGRSPQFVSTATNRVRDADLAESGEDPDRVAACYWG